MNKPATPKEDEHGNPFGCVYSMKFAGSNVDHDFVTAESFARLQADLIATQKELETAIDRLDEKNFNEANWRAAALALEDAKFDRDEALKRAEKAEQALANLKGGPK